MPPFPNFQALLKSSNKQAVALGGSSISCFRPRRWGIPHIGIVPQKVNEKNRNNGGQGDAPLGMPPRWGREGVTLLTAGEYKQMIRKIGFQQSQFPIVILHNNLTFLTRILLTGERKTREVPVVLPARTDSGGLSFES